jgi:hypothetical protein
MRCEGTTERARPAKAADPPLAKRCVALSLRLAHDLGLLGHGQYRRAAELLARLGRLLGAWIENDNARRRAG